MDHAKLAKLQASVRIGRWFSVFFVVAGRIGRLAGICVGWRASELWKSLVMQYLGAHEKDIGNVEIW